MLIPQNESEKECPKHGLWYSGGTKTGVTIIEPCPICKELFRVQLTICALIILLKTEEEKDEKN